MKIHKQNHILLISAAFFLPAEIVKKGDYKVLCYM